MSKQSLLLVDGDTRSLRVLEVSLRKAGFSVTPAVSVGDALDKLEINPPDLIISETKFATDLDGFELRRRLRGTPEWAEIPFIFLTAETAIENKIKGLELGVDDYLTKPIYIKEIVTRINILLQKRQRQFLDLRKDGTRFAGRVADMPVVDVIQTIEVSRKSGVIQFTGGPNRQAAIYFRDGKVIDAEAGTLQAEDAVYRLLTWNEGEFEVEFRTVRRREVIETSSQGLLMEGMRRLDEWSRLLEQLPSLAHRFEIDAAELATRLGEVPDDNNRILRLFDGKRTLLEVIDASDFGDLECLQAISRLYFEGLLIDLDPAVRTQRDASKPIMVPPPLGESGAYQLPLQEASSGAIDVAGLQSRAESDATPTKAAEPAAEPPRGGLTQSWDVPELPADVKEALPADAPPAMDSTAPVGANDAIASEPVAASADEDRARDSAESIDEGDVLNEEEIQPPLMGNYRQSSLRKIEEAVAAAQLIEPTLFGDDELAALGIKRATPEEIAAAAAQGAATAPPAAAAAAPGFPHTPPQERDADIARLKADLGSLDVSRDAPAPAGGVTKGWDVPDVPGVTDEPKPAPPAVTPSQLAAHTNGRPRRRTAPPPIPLKQKDIEDAPLLDDADLMMSASGEIKVPSEEELSDAPMLDSSLLTSGEIKIPSEAALRGPEAPPSAPKAAESVEAKSVDAKTDGSPAPASDEDSGGVPTPVEADSLADMRDEGETDPSRKRAPLPRAMTDEAATKMIGSLGRDRAEASGELRPPNFKAGDTPPPQRELVTIMPRRKTGEVTQLRPEDVSTLDAKGQARAKAVVEEAEAAKAKADADEARAKDEAKPETKDAPKLPPPAKHDYVTEEKSGKPAVEAPPRRVSVEGGVVAPQRGPGRGAQILIALASIIAGIAVYTFFKKSKKPRQPVVATYQDAAVQIPMEQPDAPDVVAMAVDADVVDGATVAVAPRDAGVAKRPDATVAMITPDATVAMITPDAAVAMITPDAAVAMITPDAAAVATATDAGAVKGKSAAALAKQGREELAQGEAQKALDLFDESLKLNKRDKRTLVDRGRALANLGRIDDAVGSFDEAIKLSNEYAPAWEHKGLALWSAQRYGDARPALEMYLQLQPDGPKSETIRKMLDEPR